MASYTDFCTFLRKPLGFLKVRGIIYCAKKYWVEQMVLKEYLRARYW